MSTLDMVFNRVQCLHKYINHFNRQSPFGVASIRPNIYKCPVTLRAFSNHLKSNRGSLSDPGMKYWNKRKQLHEPTPKFESTMTSDLIGSQNLVQQKETTSDKNLSSLEDKTHVDSVISTLVDADNMIDYILEDAGPYVTFEGTFSESNELSLLQVGFRSHKTKEIVCIIFDILNLQKDEAFSPSESQELLKILLEKILHKQDLCKIGGHGISKVVAALKHQFGIDVACVIDTCAIEHFELRPAAAATTSTTQLSNKLEIFDDINSILELIPLSFRDKITTESSELMSNTIPSRELQNLCDIVMEVGQRPYAYFGAQRREWICQDENLRITLDDMKKLTEPLLHKFAPNNRAVLDGSLHRISCIRSKTNQIYSLTYRIGRAVLSHSNLIEDILCASSEKTSSQYSVLVMGRPGSGKTTVIRDVANKLSNQMLNVIVVDTSNEVCGDGLLPHFSVGMARRMMVPSLDQQASVLIEAVQNHTPDVIICDEIGRTSEVKAMKTVKERGVQCVSSAHGNLRSLVDNVELNGLVGVVEEVTLGDEAAREYQRDNNKTVFSKLVRQRVGPPVFDVVIELTPGKFNEWVIVKNVGSAVDNILKGKTYPAEIRTRDPENPDRFSTDNIIC